MLNKIIRNINFKRKMASVALLMTLLVSQFSVFGDADTAKVLVVGERQIWYKDASLNGAETGFTQFKLGGRIAYCVDYRYYGPTSGTVPTFEKNLSKQATAVLVNGYPNATPAYLGCNSVTEAMLATQLALWNVVGIQGECDSSVKINLNKLTAANGHGADFDRALAAAKKLSALAFNKPYNPNASMSIDGSKADMKIVGNEYVAGPYSAKVADTAISKYSVSLTKAPSSAYVAKADGSKATTLGEGESFYIRWASNEVGQSINYTVKANGSTAKAVMYRNGKNGIQSVAQLEYGEVALSVAGDLSFQSEKGSIELIKMDQNKDRVAGVVFELKDSTGKVVGQNTSDSNGVVRFAKLEAGTYTLVEKSAPNGYIMGTKPFSATVKTGEVFRLEVVNTKVQGKLQIVKTDDEKAPLSGVTFQILDSNKKVVDEITTDSKGLATSKYLAKGSYTYREIKVPNGIILDSAEYPFEISTNNQVVTKNIVNNRKRGGLKIVKVDDANMPLSGVTFQILDSNKKVIETVVTDKQGLATTKQLVNGTYYYRETKVPAGVIIDTNVYEFKISESNLVTKKIVNQKEKGNLKIVKVDDTAKALAGVKFEILNGKKEVVDTVTTNAQGIATTKYLPVGTYYYKEVAVPAGIVLDTQEHAFTLKASTTVTKTVVNQRVKGGLKITKVDDSNKTIANVKFEIKDAAGNVVDTITTNAQGIATSKTLTMGKYTYKEIYAPAGYIMDTKEYSFEVTETNKAIEKTVVNKLSKGGLKIIKVDDSENPIAGVKFEILDENKKVIGTLVTDANGVTNSQELEIGTYYFREVSAPAGVVVDKTEHKFVVEKDGQVVIRKVINSVVKGKLKIVKVDDQDQPIANVKFIIKNAQGEVVETLITDKDGLAVSKILSYGKYTAKEVSAPAGYIVDGKEFEFNITENNKILVKKVVNSRAKGVLQIIKTDDSKKVLEGVTFEILDSEKEVVTTVTTDENGRASVADLTVGKYYYREIKVPENIVLDSTLYSFEMSGNTVTKNIENKIIKGNLKVIKTDDVMKKPLANVKFEIYDENKDLVDTIVTDQNGEAISKVLPYGKYTYKETEVPDGIVLDNVEYPFEITENEKVLVRNIVNVRIKGNLSILKLDADTKEPIQGVEFQVLDSEGNVLETLTTDKDGKAVSSTLLKGTYFFKEVTAPAKYIVDGTTQKFVIKNNKDVVEKTVYNKAKELPTTGGLGTNNLILLLVSVLSTLGYIIFKKKEN